MLTLIRRKFFSNSPYKITYSNNRMYWKMSGNSDEKGIFTSRLASKFCANAYGNFQYKFCCYPVLLVDKELEF